MATIFCFSATGNSLYAAKTIAERIEGKVAPMRGDAPACDDAVIGFVFPVYFWGLPRQVERFVTDLHISSREAYIFSVMTYGGVAYGVHGFLDELLKVKGQNLHYVKNLKSVENYIPMYKVKESEALRQKVDEGLRQIADAIIRKEQNRVYYPSFINKLSRSQYPDNTSDRFFTVTPACTGCAICQKVCPVDNILMDAGKPNFSHKCENCLACLHNCPECAIDWKEKTEGKTRYRNAGVSLNELISLNTGNSQSSP